jgi:tetratricopeptide (TPR) repeat protein
VARVEALLAQAPTNPEALKLGAHVYSRLGKLDAAEVLLKRAIDANPAALEVYAALGQLYATEKKLDAARASFEKVAVQRPKSVPAHTVIGMIHEMQGNRPEARKQYELVMQIDDSAPVAANNLAYLYADEGDNLDVALKLAQTAKRRFPDMPAVSDTVGWVYYKKGLSGLAIPMFEQALAKEPASPTYRYHLGLALLKNGEKAKARAALEMVVKNSPETPEAAEARKALSSM